MDDVAVTLNSQRIEAVVDAVGEALGVDTGTVQEDIFAAACKAALEALLPKKTGYLTIVDDAVEATLFREGDEARDKSRESIRNREELVRWCRKWGVDNFMCSSSIDFPEDSTDNSAVIALCRELRS